MQALHRAQQDADSRQYQTPENAYRHAMSPKDTPEARVKACQMANDFVRQQFERAWQLHGQGKEKEALYQFGLGLHTLQDSTSPAYQGFQAWPANMTPSQEADHVWREGYNPGPDSALYKITSQAYSWYQSGQLPSGNLFSVR